MPEPLRIGLAGLGTVGTGVVRMLQTNGETIAARAGRPVEIVAISARSRHRDRGVDLSAYAWEDDPGRARPPRRRRPRRRGDGRRGRAGQGDRGGGAGGGQAPRHRQQGDAGAARAGAGGLAEKAGVALRFEAAVAQVGTGLTGCQSRAWGSTEDACAHQHQSAKKAQNGRVPVANLETGAIRGHRRVHQG